MDLGEDLRWDVQSTYDPEGELWDVYLSVYRDTGLEEPEGSASILSIHLIPRRAAAIGRRRPPLWAGTPRLCKGRLFPPRPPR